MLRKPFDLTPWQFVLTMVAIGLTLGLDSILPLSDEPFQAGAMVSPMLLARFCVFLAGALTVFVQPGGRMLPVWLAVWARHAIAVSVAVCPSELHPPYVRQDGRDGEPTYFPVTAAQMTRMRLHGSSAVFVVEPPLWRLMKRTPLADSYWRRHVPYRLLLLVEPEGSLELMTDDDRAGRWAGLTAGLKALVNPVQFVAQARAEDARWLVDRAMPPIGSPFAALRSTVGAWASLRAEKLMQRRVIVTCSAADADALVEHVRDVVGMLTDAGLRVREASVDEQRAIFDQVYGTRRFYPHSPASFGIDDTDWVTLVVRLFPQSVAVGWLMYVIGALPVDVALYVEPDDAVWVTKIMEWFQGACEFRTADTAHHDAAADLEYVEQKLKRNEDCVARATLLLTMPKQVVPRVSNRLRKSGAIFRPATMEHQQGRLATLPVGGLPRMGATRPYDGASIAACYPCGASGLRMAHGALLGVARDSPEAVTLDVLDDALYASMVSILGTTGAGKTFLMQLLIERSGLPFTLIDMKLHLDERQHGDFYRFTKAAGGQYVVVKAGQRIPNVDGPAVCYNLALLDDRQRAVALYGIAEREWSDALATLLPRIFGVDESNLLGKTGAGRDFIEKVATQGRSAGFVGVFATQMVSDFLKDEQLKKAVKMASMVFVLAQEPSEVDVVSDALRLGDACRAELRKFQPAPGDETASLTRSAILRVGRRYVALNIEACPEETALFTTKPSDKRAMRAAMASSMLEPVGAR